MALTTVSIGKVWQKSLILTVIILETIKQEKQPEFRCPHLGILGHRLRDIKF